MLLYFVYLDNLDIEKSKNGSVIRESALFSSIVHKLHRAIGILRSLVKDSIAPSRRSLFLRSIVDVCIRIVFISWVKV